MKYLKLMTQRFKKAFYLSNKCYCLYWILQLLKNPIHQSDIHSLDFNLIKSFISNEALRIIRRSQTAKKIWKFWKLKLYDKYHNYCPFVCFWLLEVAILSCSGKGAFQIYTKSLKNLLEGVCLFRKVAG